MKRRNFLSIGSVALTLPGAAYAQAAGAGPAGAARSIRNVPTIAALRGLVPSDDALVYTLGHSRADDGGGGFFRWVVDSVGRDDSALVVAPDGARGAGRWHRTNGGVLDVRQFGARGDGTGDDTTAIQAAVDAAARDPLNPRSVYMPAGDYPVSAAIRVPAVSNVHIAGEGGGFEGASKRNAVTRLIWAGPASGKGPMLAFGGDGRTATKGCVVRDLLIDGARSSRRTGIRLEQRCQGYLFHRVSFARLETGLAMGRSSFSNRVESCEFLSCRSVCLVLEDRNHTTDIMDCIFRNSRRAPAGSVGIHVGRDGHASQVNVIGCNFDLHRASVFIDVEEAWAVNIVGNYLEGRDAEMVCAIRLGRSDDPEKLIRACRIAGNRITTAYRSPAAYAVAVERVESLTVESNFLANWTRHALRIDPSACNGIAWVNNTDHVSPADHPEALEACIRPGRGLLVGKQEGDRNAVGVEAHLSGVLRGTARDRAAIEVNRLGRAGAVIGVYRDGVLAGSLDAYDDTACLTDFCGAMLSQFEDGGQRELPRGTVLEAVDSLCRWEGRENRRVPCVKVSDRAVAPAVLGVFMGWEPLSVPSGGEASPRHDLRVVTQGAYVVRVAAGQTVARGDLLESAGDGTARMQRDGVVRSSSLAKVASATPVESFADGSFLLPCLLLC